MFEAPRPILSEVELFGRTLRNRLAVAPMSRGSLRDGSGPLSIPITCYLEPENIPVILGRLNDVRYRELRNRR